MAIGIRSMDDLINMINEYLMQAMTMTRDQIFEVLSNKVVAYYNEPVFSPPDPTVPKVYSRTGALLESLTASNIEKDGNGIKCKIGWEDDYLSLTYSGGASGLEVLTWMDSSSHGGTISGSHNYFTEAINELGGALGIVKLFKKNCIAVGLPIK